MKPIVAAIMIGCTISTAPLLSSASVTYNMVNLKKIPKLKISVSQGEWLGHGTFNTNGVVIKSKKSMNVCIKNPDDFLRLEFGGANSNKYLQNNCAINLIENGVAGFYVKYICVPYAMVDRAISYYKSNNNHIKGFTNYVEKIYKVKKDGPILHFIKIENTIKKLNGKKTGSTVTSNVDLIFTNKPCIEPVKIPTNAEMKKEGKSVPTNKELEKELVHRLGKDPFKENNNQ